MKTVLILGPCRSGTSTLAGILSRLGVQMGDEGRLENWKHLNEHGCYEDEDFVDLVRRVVIGTGCHLTWFDFPSKEAVLAQKAAFDGRIRRLVERKRGEIWGWKFPWTAAVLPLLEPHLEDPRYIVMRRDPRAIAQSIYNKFDDKKNFLRNLALIARTRAFWNVPFLARRLTDFVARRSDYRRTRDLAASIASYYALIEEYTRGGSRLEVDYNALLAHPRREIERIAGFLGIAPPEARLEEAVSFVHPELMHYC